MDHQPADDGSAADAAHKKFTKAEVEQLAKRLNRSPRYIAHVLRNGGAGDRLARRLAELTGRTYDSLFYFRAGTQARSRGRKRASATGRKLQRGRSDGRGRRG